MLGIEQAMANREDLSIRKLSAGIGITYGVLLKASKSPKEGELYNPEAINYEAIEEKLIRKMGQVEYDKFDFESLATLNVNSMAQMPNWVVEGVGCTLSNPGASRFDKDTIYEVKLVTETHVVILPINETEPRLLSKGTFVLATPKQLEVELVESGVEVVTRKNKPTN